MFKLKNCMKLLNTGAIYCAFLSLGLLLSVVGPSLLDLQHLINTDLQHIAHVYTARSTGHVIGAILSGIVLDMVRTRDRQVVLSVSCFVVGGTMIAIPWSGNFASLVSCMVVNGLFLGALETGGNICILNLWGTDSGPIFQGLHFTLGLGGFIAPLIAAPYLEYQLDDSVTEHKSTTDSIKTNFSSSAPTYGTENILTSSSLGSILNITSSASNADQKLPGIIYPFSFVGSVTCLTAVLLLTMRAMSPVEQTKTDGAQQDSKRRSPSFRCTAIFLTFLLIFVSCAMEIGYAQMLTSYSVKGSLHLTVSMGSYVTSAFWSTFTIARLASAFLAIRVSNLALIVGDLLLVSASSLMLLLLMPSEVVLWIATVVFGTGIGSFYASTVGWINTHIRVDNKIAAIITVGAAAGEMAGPVTISYFMDALPDMVAYFVSAACLISWLLLAVLYSFLRRFDREDHGRGTVDNVRTSSINI